MNLSDRVALDGSSRSRSRWTGGAQRFGTSGNIPHGLIGETNCSCVAIHGCLLPQTDPRIALRRRWRFLARSRHHLSKTLASRCPLSRILPLRRIVLAIAEFRSQEGETISAQAVPNLLELPRGTSGSSDPLFTRARYRDPGRQPHFACAHFTTAKHPRPACRCRVSSSSNLYYAGSPWQVRLSRVLGNLYPQEQRL
jgi:hypothetical protein